jgi:hypothetical protein
MVGIGDNDAALFTCRIYGVDEALSTIAGELCKQTGFEPEDAEAAGQSKRDALPETIKSAVNISKA